MRPTLLASLRSSCLGALVVASSTVTCLTPDENHCAHRPGELRGHAWCEEQHPELPLCSRCEPAANGHDGCTDHEARRECLIGTPTNEPAETSSGAPTDASTTAVTTCLPAECELTDAARPLCGDDGRCVPCHQAGGDEACAAVDPDRSVCVTDGEHAGACVRCTDASHCTAAAPICHPDLHACAPCRFHAECLTAVGSACRIATGECLPAARVQHVDATAREGGDGSAAMPFTTISQALYAPDFLDYTTIVVHAGEYTEPSLVVDGRVLALVAVPGERPRISGNATDGFVRAEGSDTELYIEGVTIHMNADGAGLRVANGATAHVDRTELSQNRVGIELILGSQLTLRNSIVTTTLSTGTAISIADGATADITYSTLFNTATGGIDAVRCTPPGAAVTVRNSIILARSTAEPSGWSCAAGTVSHSAGENIPADGTTDNLLVCGHPEVDCAVDPSITALFTDLASLRLTSVGAEVFLDVPTLSTDDPPLDIDGNPRAPDRDFAGAHAPAHR